MNKRESIANTVLSMLLSGKVIYREDINALGEDANYVIDFIRNNKMIPVHCNRGKEGADPFWYMTENDIHMYTNNRSEQKERQKKIVTIGQKKRQLKSAQQLLSSLSIPIPEKLQDVINSTFSVHQ